MTQPVDLVWTERTWTDADEDRVEAQDGQREDGEEQGHPTTAASISALIAKEIA